MGNSINIVAQQARRINVANGWGQPDDVFGGAVHHDIVRLALVGTEVAEAIEALRHGSPESDHLPGVALFAEELADIVIRVLDIAADRGIDLESVIQKKLEYNAERGYRHGGKAV